MSLRLDRKFRLCCVLAAGLPVVGMQLTGARGVPASEGIVNFGKVSDMLYRGAQPDDAGLESLKRLGVKTIINLRMENDCWKDESAKALSHGILYTNVPLRGLGRPTDDQIKTVLGLIDSLPGPVFIHCQHGCDRTGTLVACYRMKHDQWAVEKAMAEANRYGLSIFERGMKRFIQDFSKLAAASSAVAKSEAVGSPQSVVSSK
jgi:protein tyrosine/serine phosphatase